MMKMPIVWQRLVMSGETCERCGNTGRELEAAVAKLAAALQPLGIEPVLETRAIDEAGFRANPAESNRVWIAGRSVEEWLGADVGMSRCCSVCGDSDCRTLVVGDRTYETVPEELFIRAGLMAASQALMAPASSQDRAATSCCGDACGSAPCPPAAQPDRRSCCDK